MARDTVIKTTEENCHNTLEERLVEQDEVSFQAGGKKAVEFIESSFVTTVHPEGNMHHIDDKEWQDIKKRLLKPRGKV